MKITPLILLLIAAQQPPDLRTRAEVTNYEDTSSYDDVVRIVDGIVASSTFAKQESFGKTEEGRSLPLLILSDPAVSTPQDARACAGRSSSSRRTSTPEKLRAKRPR